ncbi:carboxypeptidase-like regulatory domain-containing protein [Mucilaginibacter sp.]|uniref:carboxypeptidase-like regulatory domain-containing protein n=1 Tax=Mucilaginibacter sp. TaxID=1882438 RepID=UPI0028400674|nr:carboxypeptidase-like regulatory domain-containing protein [Mucilaginibacter sp.]MDR3694125.1 carboxypeptidase-like regulatory domain-containing protein [Mucilaginibacter sp.]
MKKTTILFLLSAFVCKIAAAQTITINGSVKDDTGNMVPLAYVQDKADNTATRTDSLGKFTLKTNPNATLLVTSAGYEKKVISIKGNTDIIVVLKSEKTNSNIPAQTPSAFNTYTAYNGTADALLYNSGMSGALLPVFHPVDETKGSRYLFTDWASGFVVDPKDSVYKNPKYGFNYDKMNGGLLLTMDKRTAIEIDPSKIKSFTLYDNLNQPQVYEYVPEINKTHYPMLLSEGKNYKIYKLTSTRFVKNDFHSDGMTSTGNNYDEYVDTYTYYVYNVQTKQVQELAPKKKAIKTVFASEGKKVDSFFSAYDGSIDDSYIRSLGDFMNQ